jgi:histidyl-tRNA synthetase
VSAESARDDLISAVRGTMNWPPDQCATLVHIERAFMARFVSAQYAPIRTPILEPTELHERKSGAGIVSKLFELPDLTQGSGRLCLRPELTASVVQLYAMMPDSPPIPWRVCTSGPVFRMERDPRPGRLREFTQVGVELLGSPGPDADAEVISLAAQALADLGIDSPSLKIGHVGLILELLERSGLPSAAWMALVENLSEAAAEGRNVRVLESALDRLSGWLDASEAEAGEILPAVREADDPGVDRLFRQLVPNVIGRRSGHEILGRLRRKWNLGHSLKSALSRAREQVHAMAELRGPAPEILERLSTGLEAAAPDSIAAIRRLIAELERRGVAPAAITLDLGFGHGIGFYSQMIFELAVATASGQITVCHGGRYDGLARVLGSDRDAHGVGFAFGLERVYDVLEATIRT